MGGSQRRRQRKILPVRQDMDGDEIDRILQVGVAQPVFPNVGIGDGLRHLRLDLADQAGEVGFRQIAAQQHFVADDDRGNHVGKLFGKSDHGCDLALVSLGLVGQPNALQHFHAVALRDCRDLVLAVLDRISAHAVRVTRQQRQILVDLPRADARRLDQRILIGAKRRIGHAIEIAARGKRQRRQPNRRAEPPPRRGDRQRGRGKMRKRCADGISVAGAGHRLPLALPNGDAKRAQARLGRPVPSALDKCTQLGCSLGSHFSQNRRRNAGSIRWPRRWRPYVRGNVRLTGSIGPVNPREPWRIEYSAWSADCPLPPGLPRLPLPR